MDPLKLNTIINWVFPDVSLCSELSLYFKCNTGSCYSFEKKRLHFIDNGTVVIDTYLIP
jgi:hypothetical protein